MESDNHTNLTDEQLDDLIRQTFCRQQVVEEINHSVMNQLHRTTRRRRLLRWGKIALFSVGLPLLLLLFGWSLWSAVSQPSTLQFSIYHWHLPVSICLVLPVATMLYATWYALEHFSPDEV